MGLKFLLTLAGWELSRLAVLRRGVKGLMPGHPWDDIRGMGNRLRRAYDRVNLDVV